MVDDHERTVWQVLEQAVKLWPAATALTFEAAEWTFAELLRESERAAARMAALGIGPGDHVAVWAANVPEWVMLEFGLARLGAVLVTANTALGRDDLGYLLRDSESVVLVAGGAVRTNDLPAVLATLDRAELPRLRAVVTLEGVEVPGGTPWEQLDADAALPPATSELLDPDRPVNMQYTSGTTGFPKGVVLSSRNIVNNGARTGAHLGLGPQDGVLCQVPLFHCFGCVVSVLGAYTRGAALHLVRTFDPQDCSSTIVRRGVTVIHGVPTMFQALLDHPDAATCAHGTLRTGVMAGAVCPPSLMRRLIEEWGVREMCVGYGLTEASPAVTFTPRDATLDERCGTIGVPLPGTELRLVDPDTGATGDRGELQVRGDQVMLGYHGRPEETAAAFTQDGWLRTGDLAERDASGKLRIAGRIKEMILRGGENIYPAEVEEALRAHPGIREVAVFGIPHDRLGETVACAVVPRADARVDRDSLRAFLEGRIARTKIPEVVEQVSELPLTASGKVQRFVLSRRFGEAGA